MENLPDLFLIEIRFLLGFAVGWVAMKLYRRWSRRRRHAKHVQKILGPAPEIVGEPRQLRSLVGAAVRHQQTRPEYQPR